MDDTVLCDVTTCPVILVLFCWLQANHSSHPHSREGDYTGMDNKRQGSQGPFWSLPHLRLARNMASLYLFSPLWAFSYLAKGTVLILLSPFFWPTENSTPWWPFFYFSTVETQGKHSRNLSLGKKLSCFGGSPLTAGILCVWRVP